VPSCAENAGLRDGPNGVPVITGAFTIELASKTVTTFVGK
jgi:hypothetical protein